MKSKLYQLKDKIRSFKAWVAKMIWDKSLTPKSFNVKTDVKSILLMRYDGKLGDLVINSIIIKAIHQFDPKIKIYVLTNKSAAALIQHHPYITEVILYENKKTPLSKIKTTLQDLNIDVVIDFSEFLRFNEIQLLNAVRAKYYIGYDKAGWKLFNAFVPKHGTQIHVSERYLQILKLIGIPINDFSYDVFTSEADAKILEQLPLQKSDINLFFNGFTAMSGKTLSLEKTKSICADIVATIPNAKIFFFPPPDKINLLQDLFATVDFKQKIYIHPKPVNIRELYLVIKSMSACVSADTSTIHLASAAQAPLVGIYKNIDNSAGDGKMWFPLHKKFKIVFSKPAANDSEEPTVNSTPNADIVSALKALLSDV